MNDTLILTPSALFAFLSQIEELKGNEIEVNQTDDGIYVKIGDSEYNLKPGNELVDVDSEVVDVLEDINNEGYDEAEEELQENVEGGILKELIKTLAIGGLVRMTKNALSKG